MGHHFTIDLAAKKYLYMSLPRSNLVFAHEMVSDVLLR